MRTYSPQILAFISLVAIASISLSCGFMPSGSMPMHSGATHGCGSTNLLSVLPQTPAGKVLLFSVVALLAAFAVWYASFQKGISKLNPFHGSGGRTQSLSQIWNPILEIMRRGIMHPKIYSLSPIF